MSLPHKPVSRHKKGVLFWVSLKKAEPDIIYLGADPGSGSESLEHVSQGSRKGVGACMPCAALGAGGRFRLGSNEKRTERGQGARLEDEAPGVPLPCSCPPVAERDEDAGGVVCQGAVQEETQRQQCDKQEA